MDLKTNSIFRPFRTTSPFAWQGKMGHFISFLCNNNWTVTVNHFVKASLIAPFDFRRSGSTGEEVLLYLVKEQFWDKTLCSTDATIGENISYIPTFLWGTFFLWTSRSFCWYLDRTETISSKRIFPETETYIIPYRAKKISGRIQLSTLTHNRFAFWSLIIALNWRISWSWLLNH